VRFPVVGSLLVGALMLSQPVRSQTAPAAIQNSVQSPVQVVRGLVDHNAILQLPLKGKVKQSIAKDAPTFSMPEGLSPVVLLQLPEYQTPYTLTVASWPTGVGFTKRVFVPSALIFDRDFQQTRVVTEDALKTKGSRVEATILFEEPQKTERFVLVYTRADTTGERIDKLTPVVVGGGAAGAVLGSLLTHTKRSTEGVIEAETKPAKK
jgi:hypothetical protein